MGVVNLTPDSFYAPSMVSPENAVSKIEEMVSQGADIIDIGAVSTRPNASDVPVEEEWLRLKDTLQAIARQNGRAYRISIDTTSAEIVRRSYETVGRFIVNDISAGEDDAEMLGTVGKLGLKYVAMHKRGNPRTMDSQCEYPEGVCSALSEYFKEFGAKAATCNIKDWILDPGLGFAKTEEQNWEIIDNLRVFTPLSRPILIGAADKRFTHGNTEEAHIRAIRSLRGSGTELILRVHDIEKAIETINEYK